MPNPRKIIFLDVDGTVVNYAGEAPASAVAAIRKAREAGHLVYLVTGRSKPEMYQELWDIGVDGFIGGNGSYVEHQGDVLFAQTLSLAQCKAIVDWLTERGLPYYLEANSGLYGSAGFETRALDAVRAYVTGKGASTADNASTADSANTADNADDASDWTVRRVFPQMHFEAGEPRADVNKISFVLRDYHDFLEAREAFPGLRAGTWGGRGAHALFGDVGVANIDKARAIDQLLTHLGAGREETVAVGDAAVDLPMLAYCGTAVAMGNAPMEVKAAAHYVTADVDHDGLAQAFAQLGLTS